MNNNTRMMAWIATILCGIAYVIMGPQIPVTSGSLSPIGSVSPAAKEVVPVVSISLNRFGFEPEDITIHTRKFYLMVANYTGQGNLTFALENNNKNKLSTAKIETGKFKSRYLVNLVPGTYFLREENRPKWQCRLTIDK